MSVGGGSNVYTLEGRVEASGVDAFTSQIADAGSAVDSFKAKVGMAGAGLAALSAGGLAKAVSAAADFESQMVELEKVTDPSTAREMGSAIQDMAGEMPLAQEELAGIAEQAGRLGIEGTDNIRNFTRVTGEMATATDLSADEAADAFARMSTLMQEPIENVRAIGDATNALSNTMATSSSEITDAATRSAGALTNMGASSEDVLALNATMNTVSSSARIAGTQLRRMAQEMMDPGKVADLSSALGMTADEFKRMRDEDPTALIKMMAKRMGQGGDAADALRSSLSTTSRQALAGLSQNLDGLNRALGESQKQFEQGGSLAEEFDAAMGTFKNTLQITKNEMRNLAISTGGVFLPALTRLLQSVNTGISYFSRLNEASGGVAGAVSLLSGLITGLTAAMYGLAGTGAAAALGSVLTVVTALAAPLAAVTAATTGLAVAWKRDFGAIRTTTLRVSTAVRETFGGAMRELQATVGPILREIAGAWEGQGGRIASVSESIGQSIGDNIIWELRRVSTVTAQVTARIEALWSSHSNRILDTVEHVSTNLSEAFISALAMMSAATQRDLGQVQAMFRQGAAALGNIWRPLWQLIRDVARNALLDVVEVVGDTYGRLTGMTRHNTNVMSGLWKSHTIGILADVTRAFGDIATLVREKLGVVGEVTSRVLTRVAVTTADVLPGLVTEWRDTLASILGRVRSHTPAVEGAITTGYQNARSAVGGALETLETSVVSPALSRIEGLWDQHGGQVQTTLADLATSIKEDPVAAVRTLLETIPGPLSNFGAAFIETFDNIKQNAIPEFESAITGIGDAVQLATEGKISDALGLLNQSFIDTLSGTRVALVGESGQGGIVGAMVEQMRVTLETAADGMASAAQIGIHRPIVAAVEQTAIALIGGIDGGGEGMVDKIIGEMANFFRSEAWLTLAGAVGTMLGKGVRAVFLETYNFIIGSDDSVIKRLFQNIGEYIKNDALADIAEAARILNDTVKQVFINFAQALIGNSIIPEMFTDIANYIAGPATSQILGAVRGFIQQALANVQQWMRQQFATIQQSFGQVIQATRSFGSRVLSSIQNTASNALRTVQQWMSQTYSRAQQGFFQVISAAQSFGGNLTNVITSTVQSLLGRWRQWLSATWQAISQTFSNIGQFVSQWAGRLLNMLSSGVSQMWDAWRNFLRTAATGIEQTFTNVINFMRQFFTNLLSTAGDFLYRTHQRIGQFLSNTFDRWAGWAQNVLSRTVGLFRDVLSTAAEFLRRIHGRVGQFLFNTRDRWAGWAGRILGRTRKMLSGLIRAVDGWVDGFVQPFRDAKERVLEEFRELKGEVVGSSIVPDMLNMTLSETASWSGDFTSQYSSTADDVTGAFSDMQSGASAPTPTGSFTAFDGGGGGGGGSVGLGDIQGELATQTDIMADGFGSGGGGFDSKMSRFKEQVAEARRTDDWESAIDSDLAHDLARELGFTSGQEKYHVAEPVNDLIEYMEGEREAGGNYADVRFQELVEQGEMGSTVDFGGLKDEFFTSLEESVHSWGWDHVGAVLNEWGQDAARRAIDYLAENPDQRGNLPGLDYYKMARGGIVTGPTRALVGEEGPEAVAPLDKLPGILAAAAEEASGDGGGDMVVNVDRIVADSREGGRAAARGLDDELRSRGFNS